MFTVTKLKISGFKSFAYPTELLIEDGVTGIIGPNGCGKSNIFEAIRWVMGESSSKSLRSGSMEDVIFNGTQNLPAKNFSEVTIELDNFEQEIPGSELKEKQVKISRTIERGVGSFYKINNKDVRAKDVSTLFYDSGSGPRSSSVISQGNIDQIINFKPIERKIILEDAAGTSGLQARRRESELKLQSTELNVEKLDINLNNLIEQKRNLSRQARQAERYQQISEKIKFFQSTLIFTEWRGVIDEMKISNEKIQNFSDSIKKTLDSVNLEKKSLDEKKSQLSNTQKTKDSLNEGLYQITNDINSLTNKLDGIKNKKDEIKKFLITIKNDKDIELKRLTELKHYAGDLEKKINAPDSMGEQKKKIIKLNLEENQLRDEIKQLETVFVNEIQLTLGEEFKSDNLKETKENLLTNKEKIKKEIESNKKNLDQLQKSSNNLEKDSQKIKENRNQIEKKILERKKNIEIIKKQKNSLKESLKSLNEEIDYFSKKLTQSQTEINTLNRLTGEVNLSNESIVNLLKIKKGYENAVFAALMNELDATLKESPKKWIKKDISSIKPIENPLSNYVSAPKELNLILSQIGFLKEKNLALQKQKDLTVGQLLVDIDGNIWRWDGFISEDNLQRKKIIDSQLKINKFILKEKKLEEKLNLLTEKKSNSLNSEKKLIIQEGEENIQLENLYKLMDEKTIKLSNVKEEISISRFNNEKILERIDSLKNEQEKISSELNKILEKENLFNESESNKTRNEKELVQKNIQKLDEKLEDKRKEINSLKEIIMKDELRKSYFKSDLEKTKSRSVECENQIKKLIERENNYLNEGEKLNFLPADLQKQIDNLQGKHNQTKKSLENSETQLNEIENEFRKIEQKILQLERFRENQRNEITRIESNLENSKNKEKELRNLIFQRSSMQPEELAKDPKISSSKITDHQTINSNLEKLNFQREQMGPVNLRAKIEEEEIITAIDELELEKNDLIQAIEKLRIAINKINQEGKNRLIKAFEDVDKNFVNLFKKLFNGGEAKLELIKSDDPLQTGLEIFARPPGKKLSNISLLSGGEKTLTAIALIFSIFLINPSPICILDEVDAALDDVNVEKFCTILNELKNNTKTKFLIITHHKHTMASIDRVYGVTMAQKGISDIVSVDFANDESIKGV